MNNEVAKQQYKKVGLSIFLFSFIATILQFALVYVYNIYFSNMESSYLEILKLIINFAPMYLIALPISLLVINKLPMEHIESKKIGIKRLFVYFVECICVMYIGNVIGNVFSFLLSGGNAINPVEEFTLSNNIFKIIIMVVVAPIIEEMFFRKALIDHTAQFGEKIAIIFSALTFGLFHMNLFQFFYAFGLGLIFAYIYVRTRNIKYTILFHVIINFFGGVVAPFMLSLINNEAILDPASINTVETLTVLLFSLIVLAYSYILLGLAITGLIFLILNRKKVEFIRTENDISKGQIFKTVYLNPYYIAFFVLCFAMIVYSLLG